MSSLFKKTFVYCVLSPLRCKLHPTSALKRAQYKNNGWINKCMNKWLMQQNNILLCCLITCLTAYTMTSTTAGTGAPSLTLVSQLMLSTVWYTIKWSMNICYLNECTDMVSLLESLSNSIPVHSNRANLSSTLQPLWWFYHTKWTHTWDLSCPLNIQDMAS